MRQTPFDRICITASRVLPPGCVPLLPDKWEKIGTVVIMKLPPQLKEHQEMIGKIYTETLGCTTALHDCGGVSGVYREPLVEVMYGSPVTETVHVENGIRYTLDPQKIMFSSGNLKERRRMATVADPHETVVDLFAGIGYFSLPLAVYSKPARVVACEINPVAYEYLCKNIVRNQVTDRVEPVLGDNRKTAPVGCADRVVMGYLRGTEQFLPVALRCLRQGAGMIHYHTVVPDREIPTQPFQEIQSAVQKKGRSAKLLSTQVVKSYAPGISHVVLDVRVH